jgi:hypothetical protein
MHNEPMTNNNHPWLSNEDVAKRYGVPVATVRKWRATGTGPYRTRTMGARAGGQAALGA